MNLMLKEKNVLVTGSTRGIGRSIAELFIQEGCNVALNSRQQDNYNYECSDSAKVFHIQGDVTKADEAALVAKSVSNELGGIDILVCNVGSGKSVLTGSEQEYDWIEMFYKNFISATNVISSCKDSLIKSKGSIVCISSICGLGRIKDAPASYSVAKAALNAYVRSMAPYFGSQGVRINAICPGNIIFPNSVWDEKMKSSPEQVLSMLEKDVPIQRFGLSSEVSNLAVWLSSSAASFVTGGLYTVDGGQASGFTL
jgi:NAD(P)-dependent dehydrogenase (short-subunit alcohol dehydrogenase family)